MYECQASVLSLSLTEEYKECVKEQHARQENYLDLGQKKEETSRKLHKENLVAFYRVF